MRKLNSIELNQVAGSLGEIPNVHPGSSETDFEKYFTTCFKNKLNPFDNPDANGSNKYLYDAFEIYAKSMPVYSPN